MIRSFAKCSRALYGTPHDSLVKRPHFPEFEELSKTERALQLERIEIEQSLKLMSEQLKLLEGFEKELRRSGAWTLLEELTPLLRVPASEDCPNPSLSLDELPVTRFSQTPIGAGEHH